MSLSRSIIGDNSFKGKFSLKKKGGGRASFSEIPR